MWLLLFLLVLPLRAAETVEIRSTLDGTAQPALVDLPEAQAKPVPLLVHLHSWSSRFNTSNNFEEIRAEARKRGWAFISPDFRGVNDHPEACGSELAVQDVLDAVAWVQQRTAIDERRIYLAGSSGGGYMALMMAGRAPGVWAAVSAWVPITDLQEWHTFSKAKDARYWKMLDACLSGPSPASNMSVQQYRRRSPIHFLRLARGVLPIDIQTGIHDGHTGSVPVSHTLRAFNELAANAADRIAEADIASITAQEQIPVHLRPTAKAVFEERQKAVLLRRASGLARVTVFEGGHEADFPAAVRWLETHQRAEAGIDPNTIPQNDQLLPRDAKTGFATLPAPKTYGPGALRVRVNGGAWQTAMPRLATGGPYTLEFQQGTGPVLRRTGVLVGDVYVLAGQSNMVGRAPLPEKPTFPPEARIRVLTPADVWEPGQEPVHEAIDRDGRRIGVGLGLEFAREMLRRTGVPVGLVPTAAGGTSLDQWNPERAKAQMRRSLYGNFLVRARLVGGPVKGVLWYQGEADASAVDTARTYGERFAALVQAMRADLGQPELPVYWAQLSRYAIDKGYEGWDVVREAQRLSEAAIPHSGVIATIDLPLTDPIHLDAAALTVAGQRFARRMLDGPAPALASMAWEGPGRLRLKFTQRLTSPAGARLVGFDFAKPTVFHAEQDPKTGDIVLLVPPGTKEGELYYCRGLNPVCELRDSRGGQALPAFGPVPVPAR